MTKKKLILDPILAHLAQIWALFFFFFFFLNFYVQFKGKLINQTSENRKKKKKLLLDLI